MLEISSNAASVSVRYDQAPALIAKTTLRVFRRIGAALETHVKREKLQGQVLRRRTATLMRAIYTKLVTDGQDLVLLLGADKKKAAYAAAQEYGAVIVPTHSQNLAIPLDAARTKAGVARMSAREFIANPQGLGFTGSFVNPRGTAIMGKKSDGSIEPVFALKKRVVIPERSYLRSTVRDKRAWIAEQLGTEIAHDLQDGPGAGA